MKKILIITLLSFTLYSVSAGKGWTEAYINKLISQGEIDKVIDYYKISYASPQRDPKDALKIADLYSRKKDYAAAVEWYEKEKQYLKDSKSNLLNLAKAYRMLGNYQKALDGYLLYTAETGDITGVADEVNLCERLLRASAFINNYYFEPYKYNSEFNEQHISVVRGNMMYMLTKPDGSNHIWQAIRQFNTWLEPVIVLGNNIDQNPFYNLSFADSGNKVVYSIKTIPVIYPGKPSKEIGRILFSTYLGGQLLDTVAFPYNSTAYSCKDPVFNSDGSAIYFSSNMPGGFGGFDIWKSSLLPNGKWGKPQNLGILINSPADETAPYITTANNQDLIFYASDREGGFGENDIYKATFTNTWTDIELMPAPVNSPQDENSYIFDPATQVGYVSSDRPGGIGGADIYRIRPLDIKLVVHTMDLESKQPLDYVYLQLYDNNVRINETVTGIDGISISQVGLNKTYTLNISKENYRSKTVQLSSIGKNNGDSLVADIELVKDPKFSVQNSYTAISMQNYIVFMGTFKDASNKTLHPTMRMVNLNTNKLRILDIDEKGSFLIKLMTNNNYKIYIDNKEDKITDQITTYGLEHGSLKLKDYIISGSTFKTGENRVLEPKLVPDSLKYLWTENIKPVNENGPVLTSNIKPDTKPEPPKKENIVIPDYSSTPSDPVVNKIPAEEKQLMPAVQPEKEKIQEINTPAETISMEKEKPAETTPANTAITSDPQTPVAAKNSVSVQPVDDMYYRIQIGSYPSASEFDDLAGMGRISESLAYGNHIYRLGDFTDINEAKKKLELIRAKGYAASFILQYNKDKVISIIK